MLTKYFNSEPPIVSSDRLFLQVADCDVVPLPFQEEPEVFFKIAVEVVPNEDAASVSRPSFHVHVEDGAVSQCRKRNKHHVSVRATALEKFHARMPMPKPDFPFAEGGGTGGLVELLLATGGRQRCFGVVDLWLSQLAAEPHLVHHSEFREFFQLTETYRATDGELLVFPEAVGGGAGAAAGNYSVSSGGFGSASQ